MKKEYIQKIYAGWLAKIIGIRLGAPIEGWTYEKIQNVYGDLDYYPLEYREFAADDDSNGPLFFVRALEDRKDKTTLKASDVAEALLNYAPYEHGFFWWGGYGTATEHTAYLNLQNGIPAPRSGSIKQNGSTIAEQIGGQIFIDTWGLVTPGNPDLAAEYANKAASVTHDGNGIYGGIFIAVCISYAFVEKDINKIIDKALSYIPKDSEYARVVNEVRDFYCKNPCDFKKCYMFIKDYFGYDKYPGNCHIIPNAAIIILALLYGEGDFDNTLNICNICGWDTDCNVGNVATIMGVRNGLEAIADKWRKPINDLLICSSVVGSLNIQDIPSSALYLAKLAYEISGEDIPEDYTDLFENDSKCHFEFPGSTHAIKCRVEHEDEDKSYGVSEINLRNTDEDAFSGQRSLKIHAEKINAGEKVFAYKKTYYVPQDFHDSRYDPNFSPIVYPGQTIHGAARQDISSVNMLVSLYAKDIRNNKIYESEKVDLSSQLWKNIVFTIPYVEAGIIGEIGFIFYAIGENTKQYEFTSYIDDLYVDGNPNYSICMERENLEVWPGLHREISQFSRYKGQLFLEQKQLHIAGADIAEAYTGDFKMQDYTVEYYITPVVGDIHQVNFRVRGAIRSYAFALMPDNKIAILKNDNGYTTLAQDCFEWKSGKEYKITVKVIVNHIYTSIGDKQLEVSDEDNPYLSGAIGLSSRNGSHLKCRRIEVTS